MCVCVCVNVKHIYRWRYVCLLTKEKRAQQAFLLMKGHGNEG